MASSSLPDERCFPYATSTQGVSAISIDNPTAPRGDDPTANEMTLSLRVAHPEGKSPQPPSEAARSFGHFPEADEQEDSRPGHLLVVCGDWLTREEGGGGSTDALPELVQEGLASALKAVCGRCVVVCTGGSGLSHAMVRRLVGDIGLDACGPGRRVEILLKERSAEWGSLWASALMCKRLAGRQCPTVRFKLVTLAT